MSAALASERLERILYILPRASRPGGVALGELAAELDVSEEIVLGDIAEATARVYYQPAGWVEDIVISVERGRVEVWTAGEFTRPLRLSTREALALALALRLLAEQVDEAKREEIRALAARLDRGLAVAQAEPVTAGYALDGGDPQGGGMLAILRDAAREGRRCRMRYIKPDGAGPEERRVDPYALVFSRGRWYVIGRSDERDAVRAFRLDRVLEVEPTEATFEIPTVFDAERYLDAGAVFRAGDEIDARVRYSPQIARWILEREDADERPDGSVVVRRRVADPRWIVRHVLGYGSEAELLEPEAMRELVRETLSGMRPATGSRTRGPAR